MDIKIKQVSVDLEEWENLPEEIQERYKSINKLTHRINYQLSEIKKYENKKSI